MKTKLQRAIYGTTFALIVAGVISAVIYGVTTHDEPGLMGACWGDPGATVEKYEADGAKMCPELVWDRGSIPLGVYVYTANKYAPMDPNDANRAVCDSFNKQVRFQLFEPVPRERADVLVAIGVAYDPSWGGARGRTYHGRMNGRMMAYVETTNEGSAGDLQLRLIHEYGHVAGLAHDPYVNSAMHIGSSKPNLSPYDGKLLRRLYQKQ